MLESYHHAYGLQYGVLRYFNAAGSDPESEIGELHTPEIHLIPRLLLTALGNFDEFHIFGTDYDTPDGTCIRDYIHVTDLADAHYKLLTYLQRNSNSLTLNCGTGKGLSVQDVVNKAQEVTGEHLPIKYSPRRAGDPARLVASNTEIKKQLNWTPRYSELETMIKDCWQFMTSNIELYNQK